MSERGEHFLKSLAGSRAGVMGHPVPIADMERVMFLEDVFLDSETDIAFLNSFGMRAAFDGVDLPTKRSGVYPLDGAVAHSRSRDCRPTRWCFRYRLTYISMRDDQDRWANALSARAGHPRLAHG